jgi:hypothetical protein
MSLGDLTNDEIIATLADGMLCQPDRCRDRVSNACTCALIAERFKEQAFRLVSCEEERDGLRELLDERTEDARQVGFESITAAIHAASRLDAIRSHVNDLKRHADDGAMWVIEEVERLLDSSRREAEPTPGPLLDGSSPQGQPATAQPEASVLSEKSGVVEKRQGSEVSGPQGKAPPVSDKLAASPSVVEIGSNKS